MYMTLIPLGVALCLGGLAVLVRIASDKELQLTLYLRQPNDRTQRLVRLERIAAGLRLCSWVVVCTPPGALGLGYATALRKYATSAQRGAAAAKLQNSKQPAPSVRREDDSVRDSPFKVVASVPASGQ